MSWSFGAQSISQLGKLLEIPRDLRLAKCLCSLREVQMHELLLGLLLVAGSVAQDPQPARAELYADDARRCAAGRRKSCDHLVDVAVTESDPDAAYAAAWWLHEPRDLSVVARKAKTPGARRRAGVRLDDQEGISEVVRTDPGPWGRQACVERLPDPGVVAEVGESQPTKDVRLAAIVRLDDPAAVAELAHRDSDASVRSGAVESLEDLDLVAGFARDPDERVRHAVAGKAVDGSLLFDLAMNDPHEWVATTAA